MNGYIMSLIADEAFRLWSSSVTGNNFWILLGVKQPKGGLWTHWLFASKKTIHLQETIIFEFLAAITAFMMKEHQHERKVPVRNNLTDNYLAYLVVQKMKSIKCYNIMGYNENNFSTAFYTALDEYFSNNSILFTISSRLKSKNSIEDKTA